MNQQHETIALDYDASRAQRRGNLRWLVCFILFLATTVNYIDRQVIGVLKPTLKDDLGWSEIDFSNIVFWFQVSYAAGYLFAGRLIDRIGLRIGYSLAIGLWSLAAMSHAFARAVWQFSAARFGLGLAEGGNFPAAIKTITEWFPKKERAFATGLFNAGCNIGAILTPLTVPWIVKYMGWPAAFLITGALGFICLLGWMVIYRPPHEHPNLSSEELAYINADPAEATDAKVAWADLLRYRVTWAFIIGMACSSPIWWFYLYWVPGFLHDKYGVDLINMGLPLATIYLISDAGSIGGGWLSSWLLKQGWPARTSRMFALLICALCVVPVFFVSMTSSTWIAAILIGIAAAGHQGWAANVYTLVSDAMPKHTISSVIGIGGMAGALGGMVFAKFVGYVLEWTHSYKLLFAIAPASYLIGLALIQVLVPRVRREN